jgi:AcrR family transcriptional regulator
MPTSTFFNLPTNKREVIIKIAIAEFASHDYESASITHIVREAQIAKGSFYQYFADKKDLYLYLIDLVTQQKITFLQQAHPPQAPREFFRYLRWILSLSLEFDLCHPELSHILNRAIYGNMSFRADVLQRTQLASGKYLHQLVQQGMAQGDIDPSLDQDLIVFVISTLASRLRYFIPQKLGISSEQLVQESQPQLDLDAVEQVFDDLVFVLEKGIKFQPTNQPKDRTTG